MTYRGAVDGRFDVDSHSLERLSTNAAVGVVGLGYTGLRVLESFIGAGLTTRGVDISLGRLAEVAAGGPDRDLLSTQINSLEESDIVFVCVPTPLAVDGTADLTALTNAIASLAILGQRRRLLVIQSTVPIGTTRRLTKELLVDSDQSEWLVASALSDFRPGRRMRIGLFQLFQES